MSLNNEADLFAWQIFDDNLSVSGQLPTRTIPQCTVTGPDEWICWFVVVPVGSFPRGEL